MMLRANHKLQIALAILWSRFALWIEEVLALIFPALLFPALYLALALGGLFESTGDPVRLILAGLAITGFGFFLWRAVPLANWPSNHTIRRRAERDAGFAAGSLSALEDVPAGSKTAVNTVLWQAHQQQVAQQTRIVPVQPVHAIFAKRDAWGLRVLVSLAIFTGVVFAGPAWQARLGTAFFPGYLSSTKTTTTVEAWLNPPAYSGLPPVFFDTNQTPEVRALGGSEFVLRVNGTTKPPKLRVSGDTVFNQKLSKLGDGVYEARLVLFGASQLVLSGSAKGSWAFLEETDKSPTIQFQNDPKPNENDELAFSFLAEDDFGVEQVRLLLSSTNEDGFANNDAVELVVPKAKKLEQEQGLDLTRHVLAGLPVQLVLEARDGAGQTAQSQPFFITLPQKLLLKPLAKAVAEQRLLILRDQGTYAPKTKTPQAAVLLQGNVLFAERPFDRIHRAPAGVQRSAALLRGVMRAPERGIKDPLVWLGLSYVRARLEKSEAKKDMDDLGEVMWQIALRAEGGELESAAAALKLAEKALQNGLLLSAPPSELERLSQKYELAVKRYLQALAKQALQDETGEGGAGMSMSGDQLQEMLDALQALAETGATGDARALLKALAQLLQNMRMQMAQSGQGGQGEDDLVAEAMRDALEELGDMLGKQRELLDNAQQQQNAGNAPDGTNTGQNPGSMGALSEQQGQLQSDLNELGQTGVVQGSEANQALGEAENAMGEAARALGQGDGDEALVAGQKAFHQLRSGAETLANEMLDRQDGAKRSQQDPFGRKSNGGMQSADGTEIPDMIDPQQARKILQEIRRRAAEQHRSRQELEYLNRLLDRF